MKLLLKLSNVYNFARELRFSPIENVGFFYRYRHHKRIKGTKQQSCLEGFIVWLYCSLCFLICTSVTTEEAKKRVEEVNPVSYVKAFFRCDKLDSLALRTCQYSTCPHCKIKLIFKQLLFIITYH